MIAQKSGSIINMASAQGHIGLDGWTAYAGAKGAVMSMSRQMAVEFGPHNIRVNSISPGTINTPMNEQVIEQLGPGLMQSWIGMHPIGRIGKPSEVAEAAVYLASDAAGFTTGIDLRVDGGLTAMPHFIPHNSKPV
jgi:NAD(P)-dependent dehydrogenase (short-subunit alcohol dehydrogenase family)